MKRKPKILFCNAFKAPYIDTEKQIFRENFDVIFYEYNIKKTIIGKLFNLLKNFIIALIYVPQVDIVYSIFGGFHGFFPIFIAKLLHKKTIITVGGYDAVNIPSIKFGIFYQNNFLTWCVKKQYEWVSYILPVDESLEKSTNYYSDPSGVGYANGVRNFVKTDAKVVTIPFGFSPTKFQKIEKSKLMSGVLSVGWATTSQVFLRKGFDLILQVAVLIPDTTFTIAGIGEEIIPSFKSNLPNNVRMLPFISHQDFISLCSENKVFLQLSMSEGLPNTLCEAMLCECIPIGSDVNGIPKAIGETGYILKQKDPLILKDLILNALDKPNDFGKQARKRIIEKFPMQSRVESLKKIIESSY